jgi:ribosomal protein S27E
VTKVVCPYCNDPRVIIDRKDAATISVRCLICEKVIEFITLGDETWARRIA